MANTKTHAKTRARATLLKIQFRRVFRRTTDINSSLLDKIVSAVECQWIQQVSVFGHNAKGLVSAQLNLEVDWGVHQRLMDRGAIRVAVDGQWKNDVAIEIDEALITFNDIVRSRQLATSWQLYFSDEVRSNESLKRHVIQTLGVVASPKLQWAAKPEELVMDIPELEELKVKLNLV